MKKQFLFLLVSLCCLSVFAQTKTKYVELYELGNIAFAKKDYKTADSLFSLSLKLDPHPDTYYNRAASRFKLQNKEGYCSDLENASYLNDQEAYKLFCKDCLKTDTLFSKNGGEFASKSNYEIVEFYINHIYQNQIEYEKYNNKGDKLNAYELLNGDTMYRASDNCDEAEYFGGPEALRLFITENTKSINEIKKKTLIGISYITLLIDKNGVTKKASVLFGESIGIPDDICKTLLKIDNWKPGEYGGRKTATKKIYRFYFDGYSFNFMSVSPIYRSIPINNPNEKFTAIEVMPEFPGGVMEMMKFILSNIKYPAFARENGIGGKCYLKFVVEKDGSIRSIEVLKGVAGCPVCDAEAMRIISIMPKWKPGTQNGVPVPVFFNIPINFNIKN